MIENKRREDAPLGQYENEPYTRGAGRFGPYLKWKNLYISIPRAINPDEITTEQAEKLIAEKIQKEANRYIHNWEEEKISVENGRYGPFIKFGKKNFYLRRGGEKITDTEIIKDLTLDDVKKIILEQDVPIFEYMFEFGINPYELISERSKISFFDDLKMALHPYNYKGEQSYRPYLQPLVDKLTENFQGK